MYFKIKLPDNSVYDDLEFEIFDGETFEVEMDDVAIAQVECKAGNAVVTVVEQGGVVAANVVTLAEVQPAPLGGLADGAIFSGSL